MSLLLFFLIYGFIALLFLRPIAGAIAHKSMRTINQTINRKIEQPLLHPNGEQWFGAVLGAIFLSICWPAALIWLVQDLTIKKGSRLWALGPEREAIAERDKERIKFLERELNL